MSVRRAYKQSSIKTQRISGFRTTKENAFSVVPVFLISCGPADGILPSELHGAVLNHWRLSNRARMTIS